MAGRAERPVFARLCAGVCPWMDRGGLAEHRRRLLSGVSGQVIEIGAGSGMNFAKYPSDSTVVAVEPEPYLCRYMSRQTPGMPARIRIVGGVAERLPFGPASFDAAVVSLTLCSVASPRLALDELHRVIRPGGRLHFLEHVRARSPRVRFTQRFVDATIWPRLFGNCHTHRDTATDIADAGFGIEEMEELRFPAGRVAFPTSPHILGVARRVG